MTGENHGPTPNTPSPASADDALTPGTGPAGPVLSASEWAHVEALCTINANAANAPIRRKIGAYFTARELQASSGGQHRDLVLASTPPPPRGARILQGGVLPPGRPSRAGLWHQHAYRQSPDPDKASHDACTICGYPRMAAWHWGDVASAEAAAA